MEELLKAAIVSYIFHFPLGILFAYNLYNKYPIKRPLFLWFLLVPFSIIYLAWKDAEN